MRLGHYWIKTPTWLIWESQSSLIVVGILQLFNVNAVLEDGIQFVLDRIEETGADMMTVLMKDVAVFWVKLIASIVSVAAEHDSSNDDALNMPPLLPH